MQAACARHTPATTCGYFPIHHSPLLHSAASCHSLTTRSAAWSCRSRMQAPRVGMHVPPTLSAHLGAGMGAAHLFHLTMIAKRGIAMRSTPHSRHSTPYLPAHLPVHLLG